jgi:hypothetical protein
VSTYTATTVPTQFVEADGIRFAYRRWGKRSGLPLVFDQHFTGNLDSWDPAVLDGLAREREVIIFNNAGVAGSTGEVPTTFAGMAKNAEAFIDGLYNEARQCASVGSYTSAVLTCRKILMHIAVEKGAKEGESFIAYVEFLAAKGYIPPDGKGWVDYIRKKGNEANHEIKVMTQGHAQALIAFVEMLLKFIYDFPMRVPAPPSGKP